MNEPSKCLTIHVDGASRGNPGPAAIGVVIKDASGTSVMRVSSYIGTTTNNQAEYTALITALEEAKRMEAQRVVIRTDSQLMARQVNGSYRVRNANIKPLFDQAMRLLTAFSHYSIDYIPREQNSEADSLANQALNNLKNA